MENDCVFAIPSCINFLMLGKERKHCNRERRGGDGELKSEVGFRFSTWNSPGGPSDHASSKRVAFARIADESVVGLHGAQSASEEILE